MKYKLRTLLNKAHEAQRKYEAALSERFKVGDIVLVKRPGANTRVRVARVDGDRVLVVNVETGCEYHVSATRIIQHEER